MTPTETTLWLRCCAKHNQTVMGYAVNEAFDNLTPELDILQYVQSQSRDCAATACEAFPKKLIDNILKMEL